MADGFDIAIKIKAPTTTFAANARLFIAAKGCAKITHKEAIYPDGPGIQSSADGLCLLLIAGKNGGGQAILCIIAKRDSLCFRRKGLERQNRAKDLALENFRALGSVD